MDPAEAEHGLSSMAGFGLCGGSGPRGLAACGSTTGDRISSLPFFPARRHLEGGRAFESLNRREGRNEENYLGVGGSVDAGRVRRR